MTPLSPRLKVCCIQDAAEARLALARGADRLGLVSAMPNGPGPISEDDIAAIVRDLPDHVETVLLTSQQDASAVIGQARRTGVRAVQLCDWIAVGTVRDLRLALPGLEVMQVVHVSGPRAVDEAVAVADDVDALLLDTGDKAGAVKVLGGTGRTHDWRVSARIRAHVSVPVWLAGGLTPANVADAVEQVQPHGIDVCSGVRTGGRLDPEKLAAFVAALRG